MRGILAFLGAVCGAVCGLLVWVAARHLARASRADNSDVDPAGGLRSLLATYDAATIPALLTQSMMGGWLAFVFWRKPGLPLATSALLVTGLLITISLVDFQVRRIPNVLVLALLLWAPLQVLWLGRPTVGSAGLGLLLGGAVFLVLALARRGAMGAGDVKFVAALGAILGYPSILKGMFFGALAGGMAALFLLVTRRAGRKDPIAYGPYLALGGWLAWTTSMGLWK